MGIVNSVVTKKLKRLVMNYNVENRALKLIEKGNLPPAPKHGGSYVDRKLFLKGKTVTLIQM